MTSNLRKACISTSDFCLKGDGEKPALDKDIYDEYRVLFGSRVRVGSLINEWGEERKRIGVSVPRGSRTQEKLRGARFKEKRRSQLDIIADILNVGLDSSKKTHIMYEANLSFAQLRLYLDLLISKGMLKVKSDPHEIYRTTDKGRQFLEEYKTIEELLT